MHLWGKSLHTLVSRGEWLPALPRVICFSHRTLVHSSLLHCSWDSIGPLEEKVSLCADHTLLYLRDAVDSLLEALSVIDNFGKYLGICINWGKSIVFPLHPLAAPPVMATPLKGVSQFWYLGVKIHCDLLHYISPNLYPVVT